MAERIRSDELAAELRRDIDSGVYLPGDTLPRQADLATSRGVNQKTVQAAYKLLASEGLVSPTRRRGTVVRERPPLRRLAQDRYAKKNWKFGETPAFAADRKEVGESWQPTDQTQTVRTIPADDETATALGVQPGDEIVERARLVRDGGRRPTHTLVSYYRLRDVADTPLMDESPGPAGGGGGGFAILTLQGLEPHTITEEVHARLPTRDERRALELQVGEPVMILSRRTETAEGKIVEYARGVHVASRFSWSCRFEIADD